MTTPLRELLAEFRSSAQSEREKGNYFERVACGFEATPSVAAQGTGIYAGATRPGKA